MCISQYWSSLTEEDQRNFDSTSALSPATSNGSHLLDSLKGGVDDFSRNLCTLDYSASKVSPVVSVVNRMLSAQVNNAGLVHRFGLAIRDGILPNAVDEVSKNHRSYVKLRQMVSQKETFGGFVRSLAKQYISELKEQQNLHGDSQPNVV